jgi:hypothetical protein
MEEKLQQNLNPFRKKIKLPESVFVETDVYWN